MLFILACVLDKTACFLPLPKPVQVILVLGQDASLVHSGLVEFPPRQL